jgi:multisubunit Na+/H+ antiporter MnhB subunit
MGIALDLLLAVLALSAGGWAIAARDGFGATVAFVAYGLVLALVWVRIAAPDVALTEAAIGGGLTGGMLLAASTRLQGAEVSGAVGRPGLATRRLAMLLSALVAAALATAVLTLPVPPPTLAPVAMAALPPTGVGNPITGVLLAWRAVDTLLEKVVLVLALLGVWSLVPDRFWGGPPGRRERKDPDSPLTLLAQILPPLGIVVGLHILWVGANAPGGAFQGGTILAAMWVLAMMAGLIDAPAVGRAWLRGLLVLGPAVFLLVGFAGFAVAGAFLAYPPGFAKPLILVVEIVLTLSIAAILVLLVAGLPEREPPP